MAAKDKIHQAVKNALIKDGWTITDDPYTIRYEQVILYADLAAERAFAASKGKQKIVVEVKSFLDPSPINNLKMRLVSTIYTTVTCGLPPLNAHCMWH